MLTAGLTVSIISLLLFKIGIYLSGVTGTPLGCSLSLPVIFPTLSTATADKTALRETSLESSRSGKTNSALYVPSLSKVAVLGEPFTGLPFIYKIIVLIPEVAPYLSSAITVTLTLSLKKFPNDRNLNIFT